MWDTFNATLYAAIYRHCPRRKATNSPKRSLPRNIFILIQCKKAAWQRLESCCTLLAKTTFKNLTNIARNVIRAFYLNQELKVLESNNFRFFFAYVNSRLNSRPCSPHLLDPSKVDFTCSNPLPVANIFGDYFGSAYSKDDHNLLQNFTVPIHAPMPSVVFVPIKIKERSCAAWSVFPLVQMMFILRSLKISQMNYSYSALSYFYKFL